MTLMTEGWRIVATGSEMSSSAAPVEDGAIGLAITISLKRLAQPVRPG
jgi:hypothetical protein